MKVYECRYQVITREDSRAFVVAPDYLSALALFARQGLGPVQMIRELPDGVAFWETA